MKKKISKYTLEHLRQSDFFKDIKRRSRAIFILDLLCSYDNKIIKYDVKRNYLQTLKNNVCKTDNLINSPVKEILKDLETLGIICIYRNEQTIFLKTGWSFQIDSNFQDQGWYHFTEKDSESFYLEELKSRKIKLSNSRQSDSAISLSENDLKILMEKGTAKTLTDIFLKRNDGEYIVTDVHDSKCGRIYSPYTTLESISRKKLIDLNTHKPLTEIDNKASQVSFLIKFLKTMSKNTASEQFKLELNTLDTIQTVSSFHDYFTIQLAQKGFKVERDLVKSLVFKLLFGDFSRHYLPFFKDSVMNDWKPKYSNLTSIWYCFLHSFKSSFPEIYKYLFSVSENMKKQNKTLAGTLQKDESNWLKNIISELKKFTKNNQDFQFITIHDSISFSSQYYSKVKRIYDKVNAKWKKKDLNVSMKKDISKESKEESNYMSFFNSILTLDFSPASILNFLENTLTNNRNIPNIC